MQLPRHLKRSLHTSFGYRWSDLKGDLTGGMVASALAIPTSLSFGELSGLGPVAACTEPWRSGFSAPWWATPEA